MLAVVHASCVFRPTVSLGIAMRHVHAQGTGAAIHRASVDEVTRLQSRVRLLTPEPGRGDLIPPSAAGGRLTLET